LTLQLRRIVHASDAMGTPDDPDRATGHRNPAINTLTIPWTSPVRPRSNQRHHSGAGSQHPDQAVTARGTADPRSPRRANGSTIWPTAGPPVSPRSLGGKARSNGTCGCWHRSPSSRPGSSRPCSTAPRRRTLPSYARARAAPLLGGTGAVLGEPKGCRWM
jgi:hypothetical protein